MLQQIPHGPAALPAPSLVLCWWPHEPVQGINQQNASQKHMKVLLLGSLPEPVHHGIKSKKRMGARSLAVLSGYRDLLEPASLPNCSQRRRWYSLNSILLKLDMHYCMHLKENGQNLCFWVAKGKWFPSCLLLQTRELLATSSVVWGTRVTVFGRF